MKNVEDLKEMLEDILREHAEKAYKALREPLLPKDEPNPALNAAIKELRAAKVAVIRSHDFDDMDERKTAVKELKEAIKKIVMLEEKGRAYIANNEKDKFIILASNYLKRDIREETIANRPEKAAAEDAFRELSAEHEAKHTPKLK